MILYLTPDGRYASDDSGRGVDYRCISYKKTIIEWLGQCVGIAVHRPLVRETINQYINYLKQLTGQDMSTIVPVSYTHLDVYKRQPLCYLDSAGKYHRA